MHVCVCMDAFIVQIPENKSVKWYCKVLYSYPDKTCLHFIWMSCTWYDLIHSFNIWYKLGLLKTLFHTFSMAVYESWRIAFHRTSSLHSCVCLLQFLLSTRLIVLRCYIYIFKRSLFKSSVNYYTNWHENTY